MDCNSIYSSAGIVKLQQGILKSEVVLQKWREEMMWAMEYLGGGALEDEAPNNTLDCH